MVTRIEESRRFGNPTDIAPPSWHFFGDNTYQCRVLVIPEMEGGFSAHAIRLPGVVSQGETIDEALRNIREAFAGAIATYLEDQSQIPWEDVEIERPGGSVERWILVDA